MTGLATDGVDNLIQVRAAGHERGNPSKDMLLISEPAQILLCPFCVREVSHRSTHQKGLSLDLAQCELNGEHAPIGTHCRHLDPLPAQALLARSGKTCECRVVACTSRRGTINSLRSRPSTLSRG
jgi:hypothetical protein